LVLLLCVAAVAWVWHPGDKATPDSAVYLDAARNLVTGRGFAESYVPLGAEHPAPVSRFAPGFSSLIALASTLGFSPRASASAVLTLAFLLYALLAFQLTLRVSPATEPWFAALLTLGLACSVPLLSTLNYILSDLPFATAALASLWIALRLQGEASAPTKRWVQLGLALAACTLLRWAGLYCSLSVLGAMLLLAPGRPRARLRGAAWATATIAMFTGPWLLRNVLRTGALFGERLIDPKGAWTALAHAAHGSTRVLQPFTEGVGAGEAYPLAHITLLASGGVAAWMGLRHIPSRVSRALATYGLAAGAYAVLMVASFSLHSIDPLSRSRYWLPVYPLFAAGIAAAWPAVAMETPWAARFRRASLATLPLLILFAGGLEIHQQRFHLRSGKGWFDPRVVDSTAADFLRTRPGCRLLSNEPRLAALLADGQLVHALPGEAAQLEALLSEPQPTCILRFVRHLSRSGESRNKLHGKNLRAARRMGLVSVQREDRASQLWVSPPDLLLAPDTPRTVVLVVVDTLRADRLSAYGFEDHETPNMDRIGASGIRFAEAHSASPWTRPSMGAMVTSRLPTELGLVEAPPEAGDRQFEARERRDQLRNGIPEGVPTLAELMRARGYRTAAFIDQPALHMSRTFRRGFDQIFYPRGRGDIDRIRATSRARQQWSEIRHAYENDRALISVLDGWLQSNGPGPAFVWLHLLTPHRPYNPPAEFETEPNHELPKHLAQRALYDAEVRATDKLIGELHQALDRHLDPAQTLIVFTSDHGEEFLEHGELEHGHSLHREVVHVPLMISGPGLPRGWVVDARVRTVDVLPTILELCEVSPPGAEGLAGESLLRMLDGDGAARESFTEAMLYGPTERSLAVGDYRLIVDEQSGSARLYDLQNDPFEQTDIGAQESDRLNRMQRRMGLVHRKLREAREQRDGTEDGRISNVEGADRVLQQALRSLGYE
jgi:arylsulfatase A-like enzyme